MLPTFVIGLREGLEAALIVGIIAAFLRKQGRRDLLRWVFLGVGSAIVLCLAVGVVLELVSQNLPQRQQEGLETVIGALAVGMVTYMVVWMRRHSREMKGQLEGMAADAIGGASGAGRAMVVMAFLAVLREGFETVVFLLAAFNESSNASSAAGGALLGIAVAVALGYGIYRGGVRLNLSKFFRATGLVLVLVAAGLVVSALRTAHEAGWLDAGQARTIDLTWLVQPGSVQSSLLTGMLGVQAHPVLIEVVGWLVYLIPVGAYVIWPPNRGLSRRAVTRALAATGALAAIATAALAIAAPGRPRTDPVTDAGEVTAAVVTSSGTSTVVRTQAQSPAAHRIGATRDITVTRAGSANRGGLDAAVYTAHVTGSAARELPAALSFERIAQLNGGRLPIGLRANATGAAPAQYRDSAVLTVWVEPRTGRVLDLRWSERVTVQVRDPGTGLLPLSKPAAHGTSALPTATARDASAAARADVAALDRRSSYTAAAVGCGVAALALLAAAGASAFGLRRGARLGRRVAKPTGTLAHS